MLDVGSAEFPRKTKKPQGDSPNFKEAENFIPEVTPSI